MTPPPGGWSADVAPLANTTGAGVRIAIIDSGVAPGHPHVRTVAPGISLVGDDPHDTLDRLGHGTAVAAAIREWAPDAELVPVRVLDHTLATSARLLARAITWAVDDGARLVNLSIGTPNAAHVPLFEDALAHATAHGVLVLSAAQHDEVPLYPGTLDAALGVLADPTLPRTHLRASPPPAQCVMASPLPRPIPGVPVERNLSGVSFAVANATGLLARAAGNGRLPPTPHALVAALQGG